LVSNGPTVPAHDDEGDNRGVWSTGGMMIDRGKEKLQRKVFPNTTVATTNPTILGLNPDLHAQ
jgi:hypothetical protein